MATEEGQEYWIALNLAGDDASANHHEIHNKIAKAMKLEPRLRIEKLPQLCLTGKWADGTEVMAHRKGATPAGEGVLGIIWGSMSIPGFMVRAKAKPGYQFRIAWCRPVSKPKRRLWNY